MPGFCHLTRAQGGPGGEEGGKPLPRTTRGRRSSGSRARGLSFQQEGSGLKHLLSIFKKYVKKEWRETPFVLFFSGEIQPGTFTLKTWLNKVYIYRQVQRLRRFSSPSCLMAKLVLSEPTQVKASHMYFRQLMCPNLGCEVLEKNETQLWALGKQRVS